MPTKTLTPDEEKELASSHGFSCEEDPRRGTPWCMFKKEYLYCWQFVHPVSGIQWMTAYSIDDHFVGHKSFFSLEEAFKRE